MENYVLVKNELSYGHEYLFAWYTKKAIGYFELLM